MGKLVIIAGGIAVALVETSHSFAHDPVRAKAIAALIIIAPCALVALWLDARRKAKKAKAASASSRPGYTIWQNGRR